jgi:hypothetical protein
MTQPADPALESEDDTRDAISEELSLAMAANRYSKLRSDANERIIRRELNRP